MREQLAYKALDPRVPVRYSDGGDGQEVQHIDPEVSKDSLKSLSECLKKRSFKAKTSREDDHCTL